MKSPRWWRLPVAVVLAGLGAGAAGLVCTLLLHAVQHLLYGYTSGAFLVGAEDARPGRRVLAITAAGPLVGAAWWWHRRHVDADTLSVIGALRDRGARLPLVHSLVDAALQVVAVGAGASMGREGAPRQAGAALGAWIAERLELTADQRRTLLAAGAGAGLAVVYDVPIAGACFALEVLLGSLAWRSTVPVVAVSLIATVVTRPALSWQPTYAVHGEGLAWQVLAAAAPMGVLAAAAGLGFTRVMRVVREHAPSGVVVIPAVTAGFALVGVMGMRYPALLGNGKGLAQIAFAGSTSVGALAVMTVLKPVATAICLRAGAIGGLLTPALATGAAGGLLVGRGWDRLLPGAPGLDYALMGAAAMLAVTQRAAWTAIVLTVELTRADPGVLPALVVAVAVAALAARLGTRSARPPKDRAMPRRPRWGPPSTMEPMRQVSSRRPVVAAAIIRDGRVLACRRTAPPEAAGRWELPGGKVEPEETLDAALVREIGEELGCLIEIDEWLAAESPIGESHTLRAALAHVTAGEIRPREHDQIRWLAPEELDEVDWLEPDRPFIALLTPEERTYRAVFFDEGDAVSVEQQLRGDGWSALRSRDRFQGEDDDEDHPWVIVTNAPGFVVELLVDEYDGWLDEAEPAPDTSIAPEPLPSEPRRIKRPQ